MLMETSKCGNVMHEVRNALMSINGIATGTNELIKKEILAQTTRINIAVDTCDQFKDSCGSCENKVSSG